MISVIIPAYNEETKIKNSILSLDEYLSSRFKSYEIIAVNDGSHDSTYDILHSIETSVKNLKIISYQKNKGKGYAVRTGILESKAEIVLYTDSDIPYGSNAIGEMAKKLKENDFDVLIGSRSVKEDGYEGYTLLRKIASKTYLKLLSAFAGFKHSDSQCGIKCFKGNFARKIFSMCTIDGFAFDLEALMIADKANAKIGEYPVKVLNHDEGDSKVDMVSDTLKMLSDIRKIKKHIKNIDLTNLN